MAHPPETRASLRADYVYNRLPLEAAAEKRGIGYATARRWKSDAANEGDDWDRARSAARLAGDGLRTTTQLILEDYLVLHQATVDGVKECQEASAIEKAVILSRLADAFTKTMAAVSKASPELSRLAVATDVLQRLASYVSERHPDRIEHLLDIIEPFAAELAKEYG
jgi:hypothetical protein